MWLWTVTSLHAVGIQKFLWLGSTGNRFDRPQAAKCLGIGKRLLLEPADGNGPAGHIGKGGFDQRIAAEPLVQALSKAAKTQRVTENQDGQGLRRVCGWSGGRTGARRGGKSGAGGHGF